MAPLFVLFICCMLLISAASAAKTEPIDLGDCKQFAILAGSTVTSTGVVGTVVTGDLGLYSGSEVVGFPPAVLNGVQEIANTAAADAQISLTIAYTAAANLPFNTTLSNIDMGGLTLPEGVYKFDASAALTGALALDAKGDANATWVFQVGSDLQFNDNSYMRFVSDFGNADFVYWQVGSSAVLEKGANIMGNIMADQSISMKTGVVLLGRALARIAAVNLDFTTVTKTSSDISSNNGLDSVPAPTTAPTVAPSRSPSASPSAAPSSEPPPTTAPTAAPSRSPSARPSAAPSSESAPTTAPTAAPSRSPSARPSATPTRGPTARPTLVGETNPPAAAPTRGPTARPTLVGETNPPTAAPTVFVASSSNDDDYKLSDGAIAGIVIGSVIAACAIIGIAVYFAFGWGSATAGLTPVPVTEMASHA